MVKIITIEGNIGAGKTTLLNFIKEYYPQAEIIREPVDLWETLKDKETGKNLLQHFYESQERWAFTFQIYAFISRLQLIERALKSPLNPQLIICERSPLTDKHIFAKAQYLNKNMNDIEHLIYNQWFATYAQPLLDSIEVKHIWVTTSPKQSSTRILERHRLGEDHIPITYIEQLDHLHQEWLTPLPSTKCLQIDTGTNPDLKMHLDALNTFILSTP